MSSRRSMVLACAVTLGAGTLLQGCAPQQTRAVSTTRLYATDMTGSAKSCTVGPVTATAGQEAPATMTVVNDGGWCGITIDNNGRPFAAGLVTAKPAHGQVFIHSVGDSTRIDYTPTRGFAGPDSFTVRLLPGEGTIRATVTVTRS